MPATPARIGYVLQQFRTATVTDAAVKTLYGSLARQSDDPVVTYFDSVTDATTMATERQALLSARRRRFQLTVAGSTEALALAYTQKLPLTRYLDTERDANRAMVIGELSIDLARDKAAMNIWG